MTKAKNFYFATATGEELDDWITAIDSWLGERYVFISWTTCCYFFLFSSFAFLYISNQIRQSMASRGMSVRKGQMTMGMLGGAVIAWIILYQGDAPFFI